MPFYGTVLGKQKITLCFASYPSRVGKWGVPQFALPIARRSWQTVCQNIPWPWRMHQICGIRTLRCAPHPQKRGGRMPARAESQIGWHSRTTQRVCWGMPERCEGKEIRKNWAAHLVAKESLTFYRKRLKDERPCRCWLCKNTNSRGNSMKMRPFDGCRRTGTVAYAW